MKKWLEEQNSNSEVENQRIKNNSVFRQLLPELLDDHKDEWIVISNGQLQGIFETRQKAIQQIKDMELQSSHNLISPITKEKRKIRLGFGRIVS